MNCIIFSPLKLPLRVIPGPVHAVAFAKIFNHLLRGQRLESRLLELENKSVSLRITDVPCELGFMFRDGRLCASDWTAADVVISGNLIAFLQLAARSEDPDTLFFRRELNIEGETETGVHIKNLLDSLEYDWDAHFDAVLFPPLAEGAKAVLHKVRRYLPGEFPQRFLKLRH